jgi:hypothetical protein
MQQWMLKLEPSEMAVARSASQIYAAYVSTGRVSPGSEPQWMQKAVHEAIQIAYLTDQAVQSDDENRKRDAF